MTDQEIRIALASAYQMVHLMGYDDLTYTHLSARSAQGDAFFILPFGLLFSEVKANTLLKVSLDGKVLEGEEYQYNQTGYIIHGEIYKKRADLKSIFHLHTHETLAVSAYPEGLLPISQHALHFYERVAYHGYNSLSLAPEQGEDLVKDLADKKVMLLQNHGLLVAGETIHEAYFYLHHLQQACKIQCLTLAMTDMPVMPSHEVCQQSVKDLLNFEKDLGRRDFEALLRIIPKVD
jgi:ribulose-5-phosphate 4-epimerase/fuculose-1-phosphate aldolase